MTSYISIAIGTFAATLLGRAWLQPPGGYFYAKSLDDRCGWAMLAAIFGLAFVLAGIWDARVKDKGPKWVRVVAISLNVIIMSLAVVHFI